MGMGQTKRNSIAIGPEVVTEALRRQRSRNRNSHTALDFIVEHAGYSGDDCLIWPFSTFPVGYGKVGVTNKVMQVHRVMCAVAHGAPPSPMHEAAHTCGQGYAGCVNPKHLRWATRLENEADKAAHGTRSRGHSHYAAKISPSQLSTIRARDLSQRGSLAALAREIGVSHSAIINARRNVSYRGA